jgi:hypothetical protein
MENLKNHFTDFGLHAEWHFFATGHGKSPCDGIGGTVKRIIAKLSFQRPSHCQILTAQQMFECAVENVKGIKYSGFVFILLVLIRLCY